MDLARIGHIGAEVAVVGGVAYLLMQQNKSLQTKVEVLEKQLAHVALHTRNLNQGLETRLLALYDEIEKLKKGRERPERPVRAREILRATAIDDQSPPPLRARSRRLPPQEPASPLPVAAKSPPPITPPQEDDEESDVEAVLRRE
jgi:DNA anti-recombination protein RmuC